MTKTLKFQSKFLNCLNEAIQKLNLNDEVTVIKNPFMEADGNFTSIVKTGNNFDPSKISSKVFVSDEKESDETKEDRDYLVSKATDAITQTLKNTDELQSILNQIKKINADTKANDWNLNEEGNTASLKNKNAQIFKQNDNLCLSHDNKIEVFKSVAELHDWLRKNNYPLPKDIQLHEAIADKFAHLQGSPWAKILDKRKDRTDNSGRKVGDEVPPMSEYEWEELQKKRMKPVTKMSRDQYKQAMKFMNKNSEIQSMSKDTVPTLDKDPLPKHAPKILSMEEFISQMLTRGEKIPEKWSDKDDEDVVEEATTDTLWYLEYMDKDKSESLYLNANWRNKDLLTNNIDQAAAFASRDESMNELDELYAFTIPEFPFKPISLENNMQECGVGVGSLGSAVQYLGNKKESLSKEDNLNEATWGFKGTPFANKNYNSTYARADEYIKWLYQKNGDNFNIDPNVEENLAQALQDHRNYTLQDRANKAWLDLFKNFEGNFNEDGLIKPEYKDQFIQHVKELNDKYDININPDKAVVTDNPRNRLKKRFKIDPENKNVRSDWVKKYYTSNVFDNLKVKSIENMRQREKEYNATLGMDIDQVGKIFKNMIEYNDSGVGHQDFVKQITKYKNKLQSDEYSMLVDKLLDAYKKDEIDLNDSAATLLELSKTVNIFGESVSFTEQVHNLINRDILKEDETPADFASPEASLNPETDTSSAKTDINTGPDLDMDSGIDGATNTPGFGDLNLNLGGDYGPDEEEAPAPIEAGPEYRIVDVLVNDNDESDIKVKVQNLDTGKIETKDLFEIDI